MSPYINVDVRYYDYVYVNLRKRTECTHVQVNVLQYALLCVYAHMFTYRCVDERGWRASTHMYATRLEHAHTYIYIYIYAMHVCMRAYQYMYANVRMYACLFTWVNKTHTYVFVYLRKCMYYWTYLYVHKMFGHL